MKSFSSSSSSIVNMYSRISLFRVLPSSISRCIALSRLYMPFNKLTQLAPQLSLCKQLQGKRRLSGCAPRSSFDHLFSDRFPVELVELYSIRIFSIWTDRKFSFVWKSSRDVISVRKTKHLVSQSLIHLISFRKTALGEENAMSICTTLINLQHKAESFALIPIVIFSEVKLGRNWLKEHETDF